MSQAIYVSGLDVGQAADPTALAILEQTRVGADHHYGVRYLRRFPLGTPYTTRPDRPDEPGIVQQVAAVFRRPPLPGTALAIDHTGVGRAVVDMFRAEQVDAWIRPITIIFGGKVTQDADGLHVPKKELATTLTILLQNRRLTIAPGLADAEVLKKELANFKIKVTAAANETFGAWRAGEHDDLVLAVAMAAWIGEKTAVGWDGQIGVGAPGLVAQAPGGVFAESERGWDPKRPAPSGALAFPAW